MTYWRACWRQAPRNNTLRITTGFDHSRAHEQSLLAKLGIAHAFFIVFEVVGFGAEVLCQFGMRRCLRA
jgi:hypothetical protein